MPGGTVGHYQILEKLGEGGMGVVFKAIDQDLERPVALKFLSSELAASEDSVNRLHSEAKAISALNHPNIATIYGLEHHEGRYYLVLEYLPGGTLRKKVGSAIPVAEILRFAVQIAAGLAHAHQRGVVHHDIKTNNILLTADGDLKITDFGLASWRESSRSSHSGNLVGTVAYMSPEQAQGLNVDERSDIFSFGVVLFELATGRLPFEADTAGETLARIINAPTPPLRQLRNDIPDRMEEIVFKALAKHPGERYQHTADLLRDLEELKTSITVSAESPTQTVEPLPAPKRRHVLYASLALALLAIIFGAYYAPSRKTMLGWMTTAQAPPPRQLAVLPVGCFGQRQEELAFCEGLTVTLASKLTQLERFHGNLFVVSPSEVRREHVTSPREARGACGATLALTGTVRKTEESMVLDAILVDTKTGLQMDARSIETPGEKLGVLVDDAVRQIAEMLDVKVEGSGGLTVAFAAPPAPSAYTDYLEGLGYLRGLQKESNLDRAISAFDRAVRRNPKYALAFAGRAEANYEKYLLTKDPNPLDRARQDCLRAAEIDNHLAPVHRVMGLVHLAASENAEAVGEFEQVLRRNPLDVDTIRDLATARYASGDHALAEATYRKAIKLRPDYWTLYNAFGVFYVARGQTDKAAECFRKVIELAPEYYRGYTNLGGTMLKLGRREEAIPLLERSVAIQPSAAGYSNLGTAYEFEKRYAEAAARFKQAVILAPRDWRMWGNLADAYRLAPELADLAPATYTTALELLDAHLAANPKDGEAHALAGMYCAYLGHDERAKREVAEALRLTPLSGDVHFRAALVFEKAGLRDGALSEVREAMERGYSREEIERASPLDALRDDRKYKQMMESLFPRK